MQRGGGCYNEFVILYKDQKIAFVYVHVVGYVCTRTRMYNTSIYTSIHQNISFFLVLCWFAKGRAKNAKTKWIKLKWIL